MNERKQKELFRAASLLVSRVPVRMVVARKDVCQLQFANEVFSCATCKGHMILVRRIF